jgi:two-component system, chemotaxis family, response regulator Rcp1
MEVLLVEDEPADVYFVREAFRQANLGANIIAVMDGENALRFLDQEGIWTTAPVPDLVLLDLDLPRVGGGEVLAAMKSDERTRSIPVIVLTSSHAQTDVDFAYQNYANCYITKPMNGDLSPIVEAIHRFWLETATLPNTDVDRA